MMGRNQRRNLKHLIGFSHRCITIIAKFLDDDTPESNQWWETDSHLQCHEVDDLDRVESFVKKTFLQRNIENVIEK